MSTLPLNSPKAVSAINHWADSVTHGKISKILGDPFSDTTRLFIANAVYFKGMWLDPFEKSATRPGDFTLPSGMKITVPRMTRVGHLAYERARGYQVVRVPYRTGKVAMCVVLPDSGVSFDTIVRDLQNPAWIPSAGLAETAEVRLVLPRFRAELTLELRAPLEASGYRQTIVRVATARRLGAG